MTALCLGGQPGRHSTTTGPGIPLVFWIAVLRRQLHALPPLWSVPDDRSHGPDTNEFLDRVAMRCRQSDQLSANDGGRSPSGQHRLPLLGRAQQCIEPAKAEPFNIDLHVFELWDAPQSCQATSSSTPRSVAGRPPPIPGIDSATAGVRGSAVRSRWQVRRPTPIGDQLVSLGGDGDVASVPSDPERTSALRQGVRRPLDLPSSNTAALRPGSTTSRCWSVSGSRASDLTQLAFWGAARSPQLALSQPGRSAKSRDARAWVRVLLPSSSQSTHERHVRCISRIQGGKEGQLAVRPSEACRASGVYSDVGSFAFKLPGVVQ